MDDLDRDINEQQNKSVAVDGENTTLYIGATKKIVKVAAPYQTPIAVPDFSMFEKLLTNNALQETFIEDLGHQRVIILKYVASLESVKGDEVRFIYNAFAPSAMGVAITGVDASLELYITIIRSNRSRPLHEHFPQGMTVDKCWTLHLKGKRGSVPALIVDAVFAVSMCGASSWRNFDIVGVCHDENLAPLYEETDQLTYNELDGEITHAKSIPSRKRTLRQQQLATIGDRLFRRRSVESKGSHALKQLCSDKHFAFSQFIGIADLVCKGFHPVTCQDMSYTVKEFLTKGVYSDTTMVVLGDSSLGKTQMCRTLCQAMALGLQQDMPEPYYIFVGTVDILRNASADGLLRSGVPVLYDDLTPGLVRGTRPPMNLDDIAKFTEVVNKSTINARNGDIDMPAGMPKLITTNAMTPGEWHPALPPNALTMTVEERKLLSPQVKAVFKRCIFLNIDAPLYDTGASTNDVDRRVKAGALMAHVFA